MSDFASLIESCGLSKAEAIAEAKAERERAEERAERQRAERERACACEFIIAILL